MQTCKNSRSAESEALNIVSASSSTNTPTGSAPYSLATFEISFATESETERLELGQRIIPMKLAPASAAKAASLADVIPHILTKGGFFSLCSVLEENLPLWAELQVILFFANDPFLSKHSLFTSVAPVNARKSLTLQ